MPQGFWFVDPGILLENRTKFYSSKTKSWYKSKKPQNATIDFNEIEDARWIGKSELLDIFAGLNQSIFPARKGSIANFLLERWLSDRLQD